MGKLIIFEGLDGSGKGTQTKLTADHLRQRGAALSCVAIASGQVCPTTRYARMRDGHLELLFFDDLSGDNFSFEIGSVHDRLPATPAISPC